MPETLDLMSSAQIFITIIIVCGASCLFGAFICAIIGDYLEGSKND